VVLIGAAIAILSSTQTARAARVAVVPDPKTGIGVVTYTADPGESNDVEMSYVSDFHVIDQGAAITAGPGCTSSAPNIATCSFDDSLEVDLGDGNDLLLLAHFDVEFDAVLRGGGGNDHIRAAGGQFSFARLLGGPGNDTLRGGDGADFIDGGLGADVMSGGTSRSCGLAATCLADIDTVSYAGRTNNVSVDHDGAADNGEAGEGDLVRGDFERVIGGSGNDVLAGNPTFGLIEDHRVLQGTIVEGREGNDRIRGSRGRDDLIGGAGNDRVRAGARSDLLRGERGEDKLVGGRGSDRLVGGTGDDQLFARDGRRDVVNGGEGLDIARIDPVDRLRRVEALFL
jgi:Ca2+-binding RTX toxin-like protein